MPHKDPEAKRAYMREYYKTHKRQVRERSERSRKRVYARNPEAYRARWRKWKRMQRDRAILDDTAYLRDLLEKEKPKGKPTGYTGTLKPNGF